MDTVWAILGLLWPPDPGDPKAVRRYFFTLSFGMTTIWAFALILLLWLFGRISFVPQMAFASDVQSSATQLSAQVARIAQDNRRISQQLSTIQLQSIRTNMETQFKYLCLAKKAHNQIDMDNANQQLSSLSDTYYGLAGRPFTFQSCDTILAGDN